MTETDSLREGVLNVVRRVEDDCNHSAQTHFIYGSFLKSLHYWLGVPAAVSGGIASFLLFLGSGWSTVLAVGSALAATILMSALTWLSPAELSSEHYRAGIEYSELRKDALSFLDTRASTPGATATELELEGLRLQEKLDWLNKTLGVIWAPRWAYECACTYIRLGRTDYDHPPSLLQATSEPLRTNR